MRELGVIVFHWHGIKGRDDHVGQYASAWPPEQPPRSRWRRRSFWRKTERQLDEGGVDFELLVIPKPHFQGHLDDHLATLRRPAAPFVAEQAMPWPFNEPDRPLTPELVADVIRERFDLERWTYRYRGRLLLALWHLSGDLQQDRSFLDRLEALLDVGPVYFSCHQRWRGAMPDEINYHFAGGRYLSQHETWNRLPLPACTIMPGRYHSHRTEGQVYLPREGGVHLVEAWREILAGDYSRVELPLNEIEEGTQSCPCADVVHSAGDPLVERTWENAVELRLPVVAEARDDHWGGAPMRYLLLSGGWAERWREEER